MSATFSCSKLQNIRQHHFETKQGFTFDIYIYIYIYIYHVIYVIYVVCYHIIAPPHFDLDNGF